MSITLINISDIFSNTELVQLKNYNQELRSAIYNKPIENTKIKESNFMDIDNMLTTVHNNYIYKKKCNVT